MQRWSLTRGTHHNSFTGLKEPSPPGTPTGPCPPILKKAKRTTGTAQARLSSTSQAKRRAHPCQRGRRAGSPAGLPAEVCSRLERAARAAPGLRRCRFWAPLLSESPDERDLACLRSSCRHRPRPEDSSAQATPDPSNDWRWPREKLAAASALAAGRGSLATADAAGGASGGSRCASSNCAGAPTSWTSSEPPSWAPRASRGLATAPGGAGPPVGAARSSAGARADTGPEAPLNSPSPPASRGTSGPVSAGPVW